MDTNNKFSTIRLRTLVSTISIIITLVFYFLIQVSKSQKFDFIEFSLLCIVQLVIYYIYFPEGELYGQTNSIFISNRKIYNEKATLINQKGQINKLRDYCKYEYNLRKKRYINNILSMIGITEDEYEQLNQKDEKFIKKLKVYEFLNGDKSRLIFFNKSKRKKLYYLIFKKLPVEENSVETIMSAMENNGTKSIKDGSSNYKKLSFIKKIFQAVIIGGIFSYITYTTKNGIGVAEITSILMYLSTIIINATMAFNAGERCSKIYKNQFYVNLSNFIDEFNEYSKREG